MTVYLAPREASPPSQSWELSEVAEGGGRARGRPLRRGEARLSAGKEHAEPPDPAGPAR